MSFDLNIGIDYSGQGTPVSRTPALQVYAAFNGEEPRCICTPVSRVGAGWNWNRKELANWLIIQGKSGTRFIAGIDHAFSFPISYFRRYNLQSWQNFLDDFAKYWPTDDDDKSVNSIRKRHPPRTGEPTELRLSEKWTSSANLCFSLTFKAKSRRRLTQVFPGSVGLGRRSEGVFTSGCSMTGPQPKANQSSPRSILPSFPGVIQGRAERPMSRRLTLSPAGLQKATRDRCSIDILTPH